jgi:hypothetical protein
VPTDATITLDTTVISPIDAANTILGFLAEQGFIQIDSLAHGSLQPWAAVDPKVRGVASG